MWREGKDRIVSKLSKDEDREREKDPDCISVQRAMQTQSCPTYNFSVPSVNTHSLQDGADLFIFPDRQLCSGLAGEISSGLPFTWG